MPEENKLPPADDNGFGRVMKEVASDLWGTGIADLVGMARPAAEKRPPAESTEKDIKKPNDTAAEEQQRPFSDIWKAADETVDWTGALVRKMPDDGLTSRKMWNFYHRMAEKVLQGDLAAYVEVLTTVNPLGDLTCYANGISMRTPDADTLEATFEILPEYAAKEKELYLCGLSLRIARDLLAVLPVDKVTVKGQSDGNDRFGVTWTRKQLMNRNFRFLDPVAFAKECGAFFNM